MIKVVAMVVINEDEPKALAEYLAVTMPLVENAGARIVERYEVTEVLFGKSRAETVIIVEYPNRDAVDLVFKSSDYESIIPARDRAFLSYSINIVDNFS